MRSCQRDSTIPLVPPVPPVAEFRMQRDGVAVDRVDVLGGAYLEGEPDPDAFLVGRHVEIVGLPSGCGDVRLRLRRVAHQKLLVDHRPDNGVVGRVCTGVVDWSVARPFPSIWANDQANPVNDVHVLRRHGMDLVLEKDLTNIAAF